MPKERLIPRDEKEETDIGRPNLETLTSRETFNNLVATYSAICLMMQHIYGKYRNDQEFTEEVDSLSNSSNLNIEAVQAKRKQEFRFFELPDAVRRDFEFSISHRMKLDLQFSVTEYSAAVFQNLRVIHSLQEESLYK